MGELMRTSSPLSAYSAAAHLPLCWFAQSSAPMYCMYFCVYLSIQVTLTIDLHDDLSLLGREPGPLPVQADSSNSFTLRILPRAIGRLPIRITATIPGANMVDAVEKLLFVKVGVICLPRMLCDCVQQYLHSHLPLPLPLPLSLYHLGFSSFSFLPSPLNPTARLCEI